MKGVPVVSVSMLYDLRSNFISVIDPTGQIALPGLILLVKLQIIQFMNQPVAFKIRHLLHVTLDNKVHGDSMGPIWGRQDPGGPHVGPMNFAIWGAFLLTFVNAGLTSDSIICPISVIVRSTLVHFPITFSLKPSDVCMCYETKPPFTKALNGDRVVVKNQNLRSHPDECPGGVCHPDVHKHIAVTHRDEIPTSAKSSGWHMVVW